MKCNICDSEQVKRINIVRDEIGVVEYDVVCVECGAFIGHWAYGNFIERGDE